MGKEIKINIPTSLCWLTFTQEVSTGPDPDTKPGVGFILERYPDVDPTITTDGVISRSDAQRIVRGLTEFLEKHPPTVPADEEAGHGLNDIFPGDPIRVLDKLEIMRRVEVQELHAGLSRRDWHATETAANHIRDKLDRLIQRMGQAEKK